MIKFSDVSTASFNNLQIVMHGDDSATVIALNLSKPPFDIDFNGVLPTDFVVGGLDEGVTGTAAMTQNGSGDNILTVTLSAPPPAPSEITSGTEGLNVQFIYSSVS